MEEHLGDLALIAVQEDMDALGRLRRELDMCWNSLDPIFDWTAQQKSALSGRFLRREVFPRRRGLLAITKEIDDLNAAGFRKELRMELANLELLRMDSGIARSTSGKPRTLH